MRLKSKTMLVFVFTLISLICVSCRNINKEDIEQTINASIIYESNDELIASGKAIDGNSCYVIGSELQSTPCIIPSIYAIGLRYQILSERLGKRDTGYIVTQRDVKEFYVDVYSIETGKID